MFFKKEAGFREQFLFTKTCLAQSGQASRANASTINTIACSKNILGGYSATFVSRLTTPSPVETSRPIGW